MGGFCLLVELHQEWSAFVPVKIWQNPRPFTESNNPDISSNQGYFSILLQILGNIEHMMPLKYSELKTH